MNSTYQGAKLTLSIFGESHGAAIGMVMDGIPAGMSINADELRGFLARRAPGKHPWSTPRKETDVPEILSGVIDGITCGTPIAAVIRNENTNPSDYGSLRDTPRPGHADFAAYMKHGEHRAVSGGGHASGRLTAALCIAGGICLQILARRGIHIGAYITAAGGHSCRGLDSVNISSDTLRELGRMDFPVADTEAGERMKAAIEAAKTARDSAGGVIECAAVGIPAGLGSPIFHGMENRIATLVFGIPAVRGIEFGTGFAAAGMRGSEHNDAYYFDSGTVKTRTNHHGGVLGGMTSGMPLIFRAAIKPTPSIGMPQESVNLVSKESVNMEIHGRHDPCIVPRAVPCIEAAAAIAILDAVLEV